jgi:lysyl-tRNA synthetase class II
MTDKWNEIERNISDASRQLEEAFTKQQFQAIDLLCRETIISIAQTVYDSKTHVSPDGIYISHSDAYRMLSAYINYSKSGSYNDESRKFVKAPLELTNNLQHKRTDTYKDASLCLEATHAVIRVIAVISDHKEIATRVDPFQKINSLMPNLLSEMSTDIKKNPLLREVILTGC